MKRVGLVCAVSCLALISVAQSALAQSGVELRRVRDEKNALGLVVRSSSGRTNYGRDVLGTHAGDRAANDALQPEPLPVSPLALLAEAEPSGTLSFKPIFRSLEIGNSIGSSGLAAADIDGDGKAEILSAGYLSWVLLSWSPSHSAYEPRQGKSFTESYPYYQGIVYADLIRVSTSWRIVTFLDDGRIELVDPQTGAVTGSANLGEEIEDGAYGDADNDGQPDLVALTASQLHVLDPVTLAIRHSYPYGGGSYGYGKLAIGNVDNDAANEVVLNTGVVLQCNGASASIDGAVPSSVFSNPGYDSFILADVDGDGRQEVIPSSGWDQIQVYDVALGAVEWSIPTDLDFATVTLADVTGDGRPELIYGDGQWGAIHVLDTATRSELWQISNPNHGVTRIAVADTDGDGVLEFVWGSGYTSSGEDTLIFAGVDSHAIEWISTEADGPYRALAVGDIDGDQVPDIVAFSTESQSGYNDGIGFAWDGATLERKWRSEPGLFQGFAWTGVWDTAVGDVDGDGAPEIVVGTDRLYDGAAYVLDGATKNQERVTYYDSGSPLHHVVIDDLDGNGTKEVVTLNGIAHTGSPGVFVLVTDGATGAVLWRSPALGPVFSEGTSLEVGAFGGDAMRDVAAVVSGKLWLVDGATHAARQAPATSYTVLASADFDGDGTPTLWAGDSAGMLSQIDLATLNATPRGSLCTGAVTGLYADAAGPLPGSVVFTCADEVGIFGVYENTVVWRSGTLEPQLAGNDNIGVIDLGNRARIAVGDLAGVRVFEGYGTRNLDLDGDGVPNYKDNCPEVANPDQADTDGDHVGNACNDAADSDGDEWADAHDVCPHVPNADQADTDGDGVGDACNDAFDRDGDEWADALDNCPDVANPTQANRDGDELGDACDPYPDNPDNYRARCDEAVANETQLRDELAKCQASAGFADADGDGEHDRTDACPGTEPGAAVDAAGCSLAQFCARAAPRKGPLWMLRCVRLDWKNDQPDWLFTGECSVRRVQGQMICAPSGG
jgi:hypothetical protein